MKVSAKAKAHALAQLKEKLKQKEALEQKSSQKFKQTQKNLIGSLMDSIEEPSDGDELRLMRVNDVDLKSADTDSVEHAQSNEDDEVPT